MSTEKHYWKNYIVTPVLVTASHSEVLVRVNVMGKAKLNVMGKVHLGELSCLATVPVNFD